ncbi:hypothetical protein CBS101457_005245 [Exobasidium rhododendri]|nr:hypothetical protein CBS101457_005245 [Exobasidium rhododendri]
MSTKVHGHFQTSQKDVSETEAQTTSPLERNTVLLLNSSGDEGRGCHREGTPEVGLTRVELRDGQLPSVAGMTAQGNEQTELSKAKKAIDSTGLSLTTAKKVMKVDDAIGQIKDVGLDVLVNEKDGVTSGLQSSHIHLLPTSSTMELNVEQSKFTSADRIDTFERMETQEEKLHRLQRTLNWRLLSVSSSSPTSPFLCTPSPSFSKESSVLMSEQPHHSSLGAKPDINSPHKLATYRSDIPLLRRHQHLQQRRQQRKRDQNWVSLLPSFVEMHPHRSLDREKRLEALAWVGLEDYVVRKRRKSHCGTSSAKTESVIWITHSCSARGRKANQMTTSHQEPLLCSSSQWLRNANVSGEGQVTQEQGRRRSNDATQAYRSYLAQSKSPPSEQCPNGFLTSVSSPSFVKCSAEPIGSVLHRPDLPRHASNVSSQELAVSYSATASSEQLETLLSKLDDEADEEAPMDDIRKKSLEFRNMIVSSMYESCGHENKWSSDSMWLQQLESIEAQEKEEIQNFFQASSNEWYEDVGSSMGAEPEHLLRPTHYDGLSNSDFSWPATPFTPYTPFTPGLSVMGSTVEEEEIQMNNGLSTCEMAEVEDAMYRNYLQQANQAGPAKGRKKERSVSQGRVSQANSLNAGKSKAVAGPSNHQHRVATAASTEGQTSTRAPLSAPSSVRHGLSEASLRGKSASKSLPPTASLADKRQKNNNNNSNNSNNLRLSIEPVAHPPEQRGCRDSAFRAEQQARRDSPGRSEQMTGSSSIPLPFPSTHQQPTTPVELQGGYAASYDSLTKEKDNLAVRNSLVNLQQHLSLVAAQNTMQKTFESDSVHLQLNLVEEVGDRSKSSSSRCLSPLPTSLPLNFAQHLTGRTTSHLHLLPEHPSSEGNSMQSQVHRTLQAHLQRHSQDLHYWQQQQQQQQSHHHHYQHHHQQAQEAKHLEQKHLNSYLQAMDHPSSYDVATMAHHRHGLPSSDEQSQEIARLQAVLATEWTQQNNVEGRVVSPFHDWHANPEEVFKTHGRHLADRTKVPPTITLTGAVPSRERGQLGKIQAASPSQTGPRRPSIWGEETGWIFDHAHLRGRSANSAAIAADPFTNVVSESSLWDQTGDAFLPMEQSSQTTRRDLSLLQTSRSEDDVYRKATLADDEAKEPFCTSSARSNAAGSHQQKRDGGQGVGTRRRAKQRELPLLLREMGNSPKQQLQHQMQHAWNNSTASAKNLDQSQALNLPLQYQRQPPLEMMHSFDEDLLRSSRRQPVGKNTATARVGLTSDSALIGRP